MADSYFLESSALVKLFIQEQGTSTLIHLLDTVENNRIFIAAIAPLEVRSAIRRREAQKDIASNDADSVIDAMSQNAARMVSQPLQPVVLDTAGTLIDRHQLRALDALQLACCIAVRSSRNAGNLLFVCADRKLLKAAEQEGFIPLEPL